MFRDQMGQIWKRPLALGLCALTAGGGLGAQTPASIEPVRANVNKLVQPYVAPAVPTVRGGNSGRLKELVKAGSIYLSARDAVAVALENNIDIEVARYGPISAAWRLQRAEAGGALPGVPSASSQAGSVASGQGVSGSQQAAGVGGGGGGGRGSGTNASVTQIGPVTPNLDPSIQQTTTFAHRTTPQPNNTQSLINALVSDSRGYTYTYQQGFLSGGQVSVSLNESYLKENSPSNVLNPSVAPSLSLSLQHNLLRGFGKAVNGRTITISKINVQTSDLNFKTRVITLVAQTLNQYYSLVSAHEDAKAKRVAFEVSETLLKNVRAQVEIGAQAGTEITRAEAQVASSKQALVVSETTLLQQELRLKNLLSRNGLADPLVASSRIVPTDTIALPEKDDLPELAALVRQARTDRADLAVQKASLESAKLTSMGTRNGLLPTLVVIAGTSQAGLAGTAQRSTGGVGGSGDYFVGGFGTAMGQVLRRNFPTERVGVFAQATLGNNQAQADNAIDQLEYRQSELGVQKSLSRVEVDVMNAVVALKQARARCEAAAQNRKLQEALFQAEQNKYELGASVPQNVIQQQRDLATAQASEVTARLGYMNARTALDQTLGRTLESNDIRIAEARAGRISRAAVTP